MYMYLPHAHLEYNWSYSLSSKSACSLLVVTKRFHLEVLFFFSPCWVLTREHGTVPLSSKDSWFAHPVIKDNLLIHDGNKGSARPNASSLCKNHIKVTNPTRLLHTQFWGPPLKFGDGFKGKPFMGSGTGQVRFQSEKKKKSSMRTMAGRCRKSQPSF